MITAANLKTQTVKDLGEMAKELGLPGWYSMRKDQLVRALVRASKAKSAGKKKSASRTAKASSAKVSTKASPAKPTARSNAQASRQSAKRSRSSTAAPTGKRTAQTAAPTARRAASGKKAGPSAKSASTAKSATSATSAASSKAGRGSAQSRSRGQGGTAKPRSRHVARRIQKANAQRERQKDLSTAGAVKYVSAAEAATLTPRRTNIEKDRIVLVVRDAYWLQACWDVSRHSVQRAQAAMAENWHTAKPYLRVLQVDGGNTTTSSSSTLEDIRVHGGVKNWYVPVAEPEKSYQVELGYKADNGKFFTLMRSNIVTTPPPGSSDSLDENWTDIAQNYEKIYAMSGGYSDEVDADLKELFEERLRRPMHSPSDSQFGVGAEPNRRRDFQFCVDAEMIVYGKSLADAHVTLSGEPVRLRPDGTFTVRLSMPDRRQVLPIVASSADGVEHRTVVLAIERNTKVMEPMVQEANEV